MIRASVLAVLSTGETLSCRLLTLAAREVEGETLRSTGGAMMWSRDSARPQYGHAPFASTADSMLRADRQDGRSFLRLESATHQLWQK